jgi:hypothetical protein
MAPNISEEMQQLALGMAVDNAWSFIECASTVETVGDVEWFNLGDETPDLADEIKLLTGLCLAEIHPDYPDWIREIAEL